MHASEYIGCQLSAVADLLQSCAHDAQSSAFPGGFQVRCWFHHVASCINNCDRAIAHQTNALHVNVSLGFEVVIVPCRLMLSPAAMSGHFSWRSGG